MRNLRLLAALWVFVVVAGSVLEAQTVITRPIGLCTLVFEDNFDSTALNTNDWDIQTGKQGLSKQLANNAVVANGYLYLQAKKEKTDSAEYTGAGVVTRKGYRYGYYESRFRVPKGAGWKTSFWVKNYVPIGGLPYSETFQEMNICENYSSDLLSYSTNLQNYYPTHVLTGAMNHITPNLSSAFHVWGCEFTPSYVNYYFDGKLVRALDVTYQKQGDASIWLSTNAAPSPYLPGDAVDDTQLPSSAIIDYVRFYELQNPVFPDTTGTDTSRIYPNPTKSKIIIDNTDAQCTFDSKWTSSIVVPGFYGTDYLYCPSSLPKYWAKWTPDVPADGFYRIFMRWTEHVNRSNAAPIEISHANGISSITVNQQKNGGKWNYIGSVQLSKGSSNYVKLSGSTKGTVIADAVMFEDQGVATGCAQVSQAKTECLSVRYSETGALANISLTEDANVSLTVYNTLGRVDEIVLNQKNMPAGNHLIHLSGGSPGIRIAILSVNGRVSGIKKFVQK